MQVRDDKHIRMRYNMLATKPGIAFGYLMSVATGSAGASKVIQEKATLIEPHLLSGFPLSEVALVVGIVGTIATMLFQYLNYRNIKRKSKLVSEASLLFIEKNINGD